MKNPQAKLTPVTEIKLLVEEKVVWASLDPEALWSNASQVLVIISWMSQASTSDATAARLALKIKNHYYSILRLKVHSVQSSTYFEKEWRLEIIDKEAKHIEPFVTAVKIHVQSLLSSESTIGAGVGADRQMANKALNTNSLNMFDQNWQN